MNPRILSVVVLVCFVTSGFGLAEDHFEAKVRPLLVDHCYKCHSAKAGKNLGGLKLDSAQGFAAGGESGPVVVPGDPGKSPLMKAVRRKDETISAMPPDKPLTETQVKDLEKWIASGAVFPKTRDDVASRPDPTKHWAFQKVALPLVPTVADKTWPRGDVDRFLLAKLEAVGLKPAPDAQNPVVARRLAFALTGLPPSPADVAKLRDGGPEALARYADQLLATSAYGERWARHWLDLVRYAESAGHEYDYEFPGAWRYRDYLVRAFNSDVPYDRLIREHVAGDLLPPRVVNGRNEALLATGWWQLQEQASAPVDLPNDEAERLDNMLDVLGKTFNGLTIGCARCHDHKFDPIRTKEYYGLFGIAAASPAARTWANAPALDEHAKRLQTLRDAVDAGRAKAEVVPVPTLNLAGAELLADFTQATPNGWAVQGHAEVITPETANLRGLPPGLWSGTLSRHLPASVRSPQFTLQRDYINVLVAGEDATVQVVVANYQMIRDPIYQDLKKPIKGENFHWVRFNVARWKGQRAHVEVFTGKVDGSHNIMHTTDTPRARFGLRAVTLSDGKTPPTPDVVKLAPVSWVYAWRAAASEKAIPAPERFIGVQDVNGVDTPVYARGDANKPRPGPVPRAYLAITGAGQTSPPVGSGRRELAEALASPHNPLTARVMVNRVWHHLFGRGLVPTVDNFGLLGDAPSHPELLDYLAHRFVHEHRWSMKKLVRELVLSRAFAMQGGLPPEADAANRWLSRFPLRRLEAEAVRDAILTVSGSIDLTLGGESVPVPHNLAGSGSDSGNNYPPSGPVHGARRRSLYLASRRSYPSTFLEVFDKPSPLNTFGRRDVSNVPTQALTLLNDPFVHAQAQSWAKRISQLPATPEARITQMFQEAYARPPLAAELDRSLTLLGPNHTAWDDLALALFNAKEFLYVP
jgi:Protein of unknown function (DUF1553)/Protein of unknown function (DUF1549)/Planctomycete cytochrome C